MRPSPRLEYVCPQSFPPVLPSPHPPVASPALRSLAFPGPEPDRERTKLPPPRWRPSAGPWPHGGATPIRVERSIRPITLNRRECSLRLRARSSFAVLMMPVPFANSSRALSSLSASAPGRPSLIRTLPALLTMRSILALMTLSRPRHAQQIIERSKLGGSILWASTGKLRPGRGHGM